MAAGASLATMTQSEGTDTARADAATYEPDPRRWRVLAVSLVVGFMSLLDVTIVNVAVPSIRAGLDTSAATIQWVVSGYALAFGMTLVAGGRLGDAHGRRRMMTIGLVGCGRRRAPGGSATELHHEGSSGPVGCG